MNTIHQNSSKKILSPRRIQEKADILETNLLKSVSKQEDPSIMRIKINRTGVPNAVINKALLQLIPKLNIKPREYVLGLRDLLQKDIPPNKQKNFEKNLTDTGEILFDDLNIVTRSFKAIASKKELEIIVKGIPAIKGIDGRIEKSFFNHKQSPGKLLKDGAINFKEINKYPIVNAADKLFYITHEKQGEKGVSFDGKIIPVEDAKPFIIHIGSGVEKIDDPDETGKVKGYFLQSQKTGVVILNWDEQNIINSIGISDEIEVKKLDYSTGNIGTRHTCPIHMKIGVICNDFKIRVNGKVEASIVDGGEIITNNEAVIMKTQPGSTVMALKDIIVGSASHSKIISERGTITINKELIDSEVSSPKVIFKKSKGLITNNKIETEDLTLTGLYFSGENIIHFGNNLFVEKEELITSHEKLAAEKLKLSDTEKLLMGNLQLELKRMAKLTLADQDLVKYFKPLIIATKTMNYETIYRGMDLIQKKNNTKVIANVRKLFETLEKISQSIKACKYRELTFKKNINEVDQRMASMKLTIKGFLRRAGIIKVFCGISGDKKAIKPDFTAESVDADNTIIKVTGTYSPHKGFEFVQ
ncbi:MAG: FapA family protein [Desulfobacula sp.]|uniref:flagellar assembly protein A n=1 Tax=Desulfobacula sp. TaxID=2593537 RepID=UPI0025B95C45|nr:flagellar assembly protein A [Desulfobacula sp.]MCD4721426.1 FapA family protein [Desulfobacula sp.]